jgi:hypothetical protein
MVYTEDDLMTLEVDDQGHDENPEFDAAAFVVGSLNDSFSSVISFIHVTKLTLGMLKNILRSSCE